MSPTQIIVTSIDDPPYETKGSGFPVTGIIPVTAAMLRIPWNANMPVSPPATRRPNGSLAPIAMRNPAYTNTQNAATMANVPMSPVSSPMIARMKSVCASGR